MRLPYILLAALVAGGCAVTSEPESQSSDVIAGVPESGYPAVGFLLEMPEATDSSESVAPAPTEEAMLHCGATLIAPDIAVTAAHCVSPTAPKGRYVLGFGTLANDPPQPENVRRNVIEVVRSPNYALGPDPDDGSPFDIAIVRLESPVTDREPATIATAATTCDYRYVGYGRSTPGGAFVLDVKYGERKSSKTCVRSATSNELSIRGVDGGNCWGDSGGPLMAEGTNQVVAVMSRFAPISPVEQYDCRKGNNMIMIRTDVNRDFLATYVPSLAKP